MTYSEDKKLKYCFKIVCNVFVDHENMGIDTKISFLAAFVAKLQSFWSIVCHLCDFHSPRGIFYYTYTILEDKKLMYCFEIVCSVFVDHENMGIDTKISLVAAFVAKLQSFLGIVCHLYDFPLPEGYILLHLYHIGR